MAASNTAPQGLDFSNLRGDFFGGLTAGIVALPLALAFGEQTALGAMAGLYGAIAIGIVAAIFGGTPTQISGPTAPMTVVSSAVIASAITASGADTTAEALPLIIAVFFLAGLIEMLLGIFRIGQYIKYIPHPVVSGFMSGIGVIIIITQLFPLLGYNPSADTEFVNGRLPHAEAVILERILEEEEREGVLSGAISQEEIEETARRARLITQEDIQEQAEKDAARAAGGTLGTIRNIDRPFLAENGINYPNLIVALITILIIYGFKYITKAVPSTLVALVVVSIGVYFLLPGQVPTIGTVESGLPRVYLNFFGNYADLGTLGLIIEFGFTLAALGAIDSLLTSVVADNITQTRHNSNRELIGQGLGNMGAALIAGLPGAGATMRTVINAQSGGRTKISGVIAGLFLLAVLLGLGPVVAYIPNAVLAGILFTVGIGIIDYKTLRHLRKIPLSEGIVMLTVLSLTVFVDLLVAVAIGMVLAALLFMKNIADIVEERTTSTNLQELASGSTAWADEGELAKQLGPRGYIKHLEGPLFFGSVNRFMSILRFDPEKKLVIFRMINVSYMDQSGLYALENAVQKYRGNDTAVFFTGLQAQPLDMMHRINLIPGLIPEEYVFGKFRDCIDWLHRELEEHGSLDHLGERQGSHAVMVSNEVDEI